MKSLLLCLCVVVLAGCTHTQTVTVDKDGVIRDITITRKGWEVTEVKSVERPAKSSGSS